ncbi:hypothetical protein MHBO_001647 [Bonamia ostreae]|uniref:CR-type domain-containing protein n=1 Tax=Bonamia ostreae TaxID=126728 RepID=A0ABV2AKU3_9EUKA
MSDIFGDIFGGAANRNRNFNPPRRGRDIQIRIHVSFMEAVNGCKKRISFSRENSCGVCNGTGEKTDSGNTVCSDCHGRGTKSTVRGPMMMQTLCNSCGGTGRRIQNCGTCFGTGKMNEFKNLNVVVPKGVDNGTKVKISKEGNSGSFGGSRGDIQLLIDVEPHPEFERQGSDVHLNIDLDFADAILGTKKRIPTLNGEVILTVKPGTQPGEVNRMAGKGIKVLNRPSYGDQFVHFNVSLPKKLNAEQKKLMNEFQKSRGKFETGEKDNLKNENIEKANISNNKILKRKKKRSGNFFSRILGRE